MSVRENWVRRLALLDRDPLWASWSEPPTTRILIARLHKALSEAPPNLLQEFDQLDESTLAAEASRKLAFLSARERIPPGCDPAEALRRGACLLRALDEHLFETAEGPVVDPEEEWRCAEIGVYVVPVARNVVQNGGPRTGQTFDRRGLLFHRIIPTHVDEVRIGLTRHPDLSDRSIREPPPPRTFGAAAFMGFSLKYDTLEAKRFVVTAAGCRGGLDKAVSRQVDAARAASCDTVLWPELTMPLDAVSLVCAGLVGDPLRSAHPPFVVAGSWHVARDGSYSNLAPVLDGRGQQILMFGKMRRFTFRGLTEAIEIPSVVEIVVTDRELVAFAICKDFCDKARDGPVTGLDIDLALVPSMGPPNTMTAHRDVADDMKVRFGTRTFVVQQSYPLPGAPKPEPEEAAKPRRKARNSVPAAARAPAYVLPLPKEPRAQELGNLAANREFTTFRAEE